jgi:hypothetical protein
LPGLVAVARLVFVILFAVIAVRMAVRGKRRLPTLAAMALIAIALFVSELSRLGAPTIWFPFNIGVTLSQYAYALSLLLLPFAFPRIDAPGGRAARKGQI